MAQEINKIKDIVVREFGIPIICQLVDDNGSAVDMSAYTDGIVVTTFAPNDVAKKAFTGSFVTDGSDGRIQFSPSSTTYFDIPGIWKGQAKFLKSGTEAKSDIFKIYVEEALDDVST